MESATHTNYADILSRIAEAPQWFDEVAVPRYCAFAPDKTARIHKHEALLVLAGCQSCAHLYRLAITRPRHDPSLELEIRKRTLGYGDPPNIGCCSPGRSETVIVLQVLEYWRILRPSLQWERDRSLEVGVVNPDEMERPCFAAYADLTRNPLDPILEAPGGDQFAQVVGDLRERYPAARPDEIDGIVRQVWKIGIGRQDCLDAAWDALRSTPRPG
jgi:hypothetical protein